MLFKPFLRLSDFLQTSNSIVSLGRFENKYSFIKIVFVREEIIVRSKVEILVENVVENLSDLEDFTN